MRVYSGVYASESAITFTFNFNVGGKCSLLCEQSEICFTFYADSLKHKTLTLAMVEIKLSMEQTTPVDVTNDDLS